MEAEELRQRLAQALPDAQIDAKSDTIAVCVDGVRRYYDGIDWSIVPVVVADIEAHGWGYDMGRFFAQDGFYYEAEVGTEQRVYESQGATVVEALCRAYITAMGAEGWELIIG